MQNLQQLVQSVIVNALREDVGSGDITSRAMLPSSKRIRARIAAKAPGIVAGTRMACWAFEAVDPKVRCRILRQDGQSIRKGEIIIAVDGSAHGIFAAERVALNSLGHLCGIATLTREFVRRAGAPTVQILDTRKTHHGLRGLEKYAVRMGGGHNHRMGMDDAVLIKTNHLRLMGRGARGKGQESMIQHAIQRAKRRCPGKLIEIEVTSLSELKAALAGWPDVIMLENWRMADIRKAVRLRASISARSPLPVPCAPPLLEVSGGVTLANVRQIAASGVDRISIGRLTHSAPALDVSLRVDV